MSVFVLYFVFTYTDGTVLLSRLLKAVDVSDGASLNTWFTPNCQKMNPALAKSLKAHEIRVEPKTEDIFGVVFGSLDLWILDVSFQLRSLRL